MTLLTEREIIAKFGTPNETGKGYLVQIDLPYPMRLAWNKTQKVTRMNCHKLAADAFKAVFNELLAHYGYNELVRLEIDVFGGCFNYRKMRGGSKLSAHSWGICIDLNPDKNGLKTPVAKAQFAKPEYNKMFEIFERHGFVNLGKVIGSDTMHFQYNKK